jgi:hypothetical protein
MKNPLVDRIDKLFLAIGEAATFAEFEKLGCPEANVRAVLDALRPFGGHIETRQETPVLLASFQILQSLKDSGRVGRAGRPSAGLTIEERCALVRLIGDNVTLFCGTHRLTEANLGSALLGKPVVLATVQFLRTLLGAV